MTAYELADQLDSITYSCTIEEWRASPIGNAANMLREQAVEIENLKEQLTDALTYKTMIQTMEKTYDNHFKKAIGTK